MIASRWFSLLLVTFGLSAQAAGSAPAWPTGLPSAAAARLDAQAGGIVSWTLANGFKIILAPFPQAGSARVTLYASAASARAGEALAALQDEVARVLRDGLTAAEIERARRSWLEARKTLLRSEAGYAGLLAQGLLHGRDPAWLAAFEARMASVTAAEVNAALRRYLVPASVVWAAGRGS